MFFEVSRVVLDTWHVLSYSQCATCQVGEIVKQKTSSGTHGRHVATHDWMEIQGRWIW